MRRLSRLHELQVNVFTPTATLVLVGSLLLSTYGYLHDGKPDVIVLGTLNLAALSSNVLLESLKKRYAVPQYPRLVNRDTVLIEHVLPLVAEEWVRLNPQITMR